MQSVELTSSRKAAEGGAEALPKVSLTIQCMIMLFDCCLERKTKNASAEMCLFFSFWGLVWARRNIEA